MQRYSRYRLSVFVICRETTCTRVWYVHMFVHVWCVCVHLCTTHVGVFVRAWMCVRVCVCVQGTHLEGVCWAERLWSPLQACGLEPGAQEFCVSCLSVTAASPT